MSIFIRGCRPPILTRCDTPYFPEGLRSASTGTRLPILVKSSIESLTPAECAIARRWRTAFVEPPRAITTVMAFSNAFLVRMSLGRTPALRSATAASPARRQSSRFSGPTASWLELSGRLMPRASMADAIVFAVYIPPHEPGPGIEHTSTACRPASSSFPAECRPTASKTETMSHSLFDPGSIPGRIVPP